MKIYLLIITLILTTVNLFPQNKSEFNKAEKLFQAGKYEESITHYQKYLTSNPKDSYSAGQIAFAYLFLGQYEQSKAEFTNAIEIENKISDFYNGRGLAKAYLNDLQSAIEDFTKAIELDPKFSQAYLNRGSAYSSIGNYDYSINDLLAAEKLDNKNPDINFQLARLYAIKEDYKKTIEQYNLAEKKGMKTDELYLNKASAYYKQDKFEKAIEIYTKLIKQSPENVEAINNRAVLYSELGKEDLAQKDRERLYKITGVEFKKIEEYEYERISSINNKFSIDAPKDWIIEKNTGDDEESIVITIPQKEKNPKYKAVNVTLSFNSNMKEKYNIENPDELIAFWQQSQLKNTASALEYSLMSQKQFTLNGNKATLFHTGLKQTENSLPLTLYELVTAKPNILFYGYFQSPADDFKYFEPIFDKMIKSILIN